ncbi:DUF2975 domain-containing protein [Brenneria populi subsp. brevivirga]|uniref:DUF2975 domain-containing protein n=1 Tax=Brenneria populi TaxID=1505588 RepID=UPI002E1889C1|nr:DUF2975 domain-containing protein [Brenneria populi subsp. brevivirga]
MSPDRLALFCRRMAVVTLWLIIIMLALNAAVWLFPMLASVDGGYGIAFSLSDRLISSLNQDLDSFPWWQRLGAMLLSGVPLLALAAGLLNLRSLFANYASRDYFSPSSSGHLEKMGRAVVLWVVLNFLCEPLLSFWMTMREPAGQRLISLSADSSGVVALFLAACIIVIARILRRASEISAENQQFV